MALVQTDPNLYLSVDDAARRLRVRTYSVLQVLDSYGLTASIRSKLGRQITIRAGDLPAIRRMMREEALQHSASALTA